MYDGPFVYDWDALNRLVRVERDDGVSTLTTIAENEWDTKNRRVYRWCDDSVSGVDEALVFVHAGGQIIEEWNVDGTTALKRRWVFGGSGDRLFRRVDSTDFVLLEKLNGSIVSQVDPSRKLPSCTSCLNSKSQATHMIPIYINTAVAKCAVNLY